MMLKALCFLTATASADFFQVPLQPGNLAYTQPGAYVSGLPSAAAAPVVVAPYAEVTPPASSSGSSDMLAAGAVVGMFAVMGYSVGRSTTGATPARARGESLGALAKRAPEDAALRALARRAPEVMMTSIRPGDIGTTRPLGVYDPLGLMTKNPEKYRRFQELEIKHGRIAMLAVLHVIVTGAGYKWAGYCSYLSFPPLKFEDIPGGTLASWEALPQAGWAQIVALIAILDNSLFAQLPENEPGNVVAGKFGDRIPWVRYQNPQIREYKLNAERNNGRAAMMGIIGMMIHEGLTGNPIFPIEYVPGKFPLIPDVPPLSFLFAG